MNRSLTCSSCSSPATVSPPIEPDLYSCWPGRRPRRCSCCQSRRRVAQHSLSGAIRAARTQQTWSQNCVRARLASQVQSRASFALVWRWPTVASHSSFSFALHVGAPAAWPRALLCSARQPCPIFFSAEPLQQVGDSHHRTFFGWLAWPHLEQDDRGARSSVRHSLAGYDCLPLASAGLERCVAVRGKLFGMFARFRHNNQTI
jgi:hypothetical protein